MCTEERDREQLDPCESLFFLRVLIDAAELCQGGFEIVGDFPSKDSRGR